MTTVEGSEPVPVGYIRRAHGISGAVVIRPLTDAPDLRFVVGARFATDHDDHPDLTIAAVQPHREGLLTSFEEVSDRDSAESLRGTTLTIDRVSRRELGDDEYWPEDLVGLKVEDLAGVVLGTVEAIVHGAAQDRIAVRTANDSIVEVPFVTALVPRVRVGEGVITMDPPQGLF